MTNDGIAVCRLPSSDRAVIFGKVVIRLRWLGHTARMPQSRLPFRCMFGQLPSVRTEGKPRDSWQSLAYHDQCVLYIQYEWHKPAMDQTGWRPLYYKPCEG